MKKDEKRFDFINSVCLNNVIFYEQVIFLMARTNIFFFSP